MRNAEDDERLHRARARWAKIQKELKSKAAEHHRRKVFLLVFWFYVIVTVGIIRRFRDADAEAVK